MALLFAPTRRFQGISRLALVNNVTIRTLARTKTVSDETSNGNSTESKRGNNGAFALFAVEHLSSMPYPDVVKAAKTSEILLKEWENAEPEQVKMFNSMAAKSNSLRSFFRGLNKIISNVAEQVAHDTKAQKNSRKNKPTNRINGFAYFVKETSPSVRSEHSTLSPTEQLKIIASRWRELGETDKKKYNDLAAQKSAEANSASA